MGNAFSDCSGSSPAHALTNAQNSRLCESNGYFSEIESSHIRQVQQEAKEVAMASVNDSVNLILTIWRHAHHLGMNNSEIDSLANIYMQRYKTIETFCPCLNSMKSLTCALRQKILHGGDFVEFVSEICSGAYGNRTTLDFVWDICCCDGEEIHLEQTTPAKTIVGLCVEIAELAHHMTLDQELEESRNIKRVEAVMESFTNSLLEYANSSNQDPSFDLGGSIAANVPSTEKKESISKRTFMEWHRKVTPDLLHNSVGKFFLMLFFPPRHYLIKQSETLFRKYNRIVLHSSKELIPRTAAKLKESEVVPMKSAVFGQNYASTMSPTTNSLTECAATATFPPEVFALTTMSASKFGNEWYRVYSGTEDGWTFNQLEHSIIGYQGPTLIVIQASSENHPGKAVTFGAYTASKWEKNKKAYFGSADCFLFQLEPTLRVMKSLPKMGTRGGHYMYFHSNTNVVSNNIAKNDELAEGFGFGGTLKNPRLFVDRSLEYCRVMSCDTSFEEGLLGFEPSDDPLSSSYYVSISSSSTLHIDTLEIYAVGDMETIRRGFQALDQYRDIADANLRNARTVDKAAFMGDLRNGVIESKAFAHRGQIDGRANGCLKGDEDGKANGL